MPETQESEQWNIYTTLLAATLILLIIQTLVSAARQPDFPTYLAGRQSVASPVRYPHESATYRSADVPLGYANMRRGLGIKDASMPKWTAGRDGSVVDIWRRAVDGPCLATPPTAGAGPRQGVSKVSDDGGDANGKERKLVGCVRQLDGEQDTTYDFKDLDSQVRALGEWLVQGVTAGQARAETKVAICMGNSVQWIVAFFGCVRAGVTPVLIPPPPNQSASDDGELLALLQSTGASTLIAAAGSVAQEALTQTRPVLRRVVWVQAPPSWSNLPEAAQSRELVFSAWHEIVKPENNLATTGEAEHAVTSADNDKAALPGVVMLHGTRQRRQIVEYSQQNLVAAVSAQLAVLPRSFGSTSPQHNLTAQDNIMLLAPLTDVYPLTLLLAGLFSNSSITLTCATESSVAYDSTTMAAQPSPTIIVARPGTLAAKYAQAEARMSAASFLRRYWHRRDFQALELGNMPSSKLRSRGVRLIYTYTDATTSPQLTLKHSNGNDVADRLTARQLTVLRVATGARIIYACAAPGVAGAVCQTNCLDYSAHGRDIDEPSHVGPPLSCLEMKLLFPKQDATVDQVESEAQTTGHPVVAGPAVAGGTVTLDQALFTLTDADTFVSL